MMDYENTKTSITQNSLESDIIKLIDRIKMHCDLEDLLFSDFELKSLYPFLRILLRKFLSYNILKKLEDISLTCEMEFTASKISNYLSNLEKKLFQNNKLHVEKQISRLEDIDPSKQFKNKFEFENNRNGNEYSKPVPHFLVNPNHNSQHLQEESPKHKSNNTNGNCKEGVQGKIFQRVRKMEGQPKTKDPVDISSYNKLKNTVPSIESPRVSMGDDRYSRFFNKFILKDKKVKKSIPTNNNSNSQNVFTKRVPDNKKYSHLAPNRLERGKGGRMVQKDNDAPDFFMINRMFNKDAVEEYDPSKNINGNHKNNKNDLENLKTRKLPDMKDLQQKPRKRRIRSSYTYKKTIQGKRCLEDYEDNNIINIKSKTDLLKAFEEDLYDEANSLPTENLINISQPNFQNITAQKSNQQKNIDSQDNEDKTTNCFNTKFETKQNDSNETQLNLNTTELIEDRDNNDSTKDLIEEIGDKENKRTTVKQRKSSVSNKQRKKSLESQQPDVEYADWENDVFARRTPTKDFLMNGGESES